jgi:hypothetical protein
LLAKGAYFTEITLHNPGAEEVRFRSRLSGASLAHKPCSGSDSSFDSLAPDSVLEINCANLLKEVDLSPERIHTGFVFLDSLAQLSVAALHTVAGADGYVVAFTFEDIVPSPIKLTRISHEQSLS